MSAVPSACYDSGSVDDDQEEFLDSLGEQSPWICKNNCLFINFTGVVCG